MGFLTVADDVFVMMEKNLPGHPGCNHGDM